MIPLPLILAELIMALGGALFAANAYALVRARRADGPQPARGRAVFNIFVGLLVFVWGLASFLAGTS